VRLEQLMRIASEFGFTPASRSRIFSFDQKNSLLFDGVGETDPDNLYWREAPSLSVNVKKKQAACQSAFKFDAVRYCFRTLVEASAFKRQFGNAPEGRAVASGN
jgi:hypothetical protein